MTADSEDTRRRSGLVVGAVFAVVVGAMIVSIAAAHVRSPVTHTRSHRAVHLPPASQSPPSQTALSAAPHAQQPAATIGIALLLGGLIVLVVILFVGLRLVLRVLRSVQLRRRGGPARLAPGEAAAPELVQHMTDAVDSALEELADPTRSVNDAIIQCWQRLTEAARDIGIAPVASDTPEEAIGRVFAAAAVSATPLRVLAGLYREARFSAHEMSAADVAKARSALEYVLGDLRDSAAGSTAGSTADGTTNGPVARGPRDGQV